MDGSSRGTPPAFVITDWGSGRSSFPTFGRIERRGGKRSGTGLRCCGCSGAGFCIEPELCNDAADQRLHTSGHGAEGKIMHNFHISAPDSNRPRAPFCFSISRLVTLTCSLKGLDFQKHALRKLAERH